MSSFTCCIWWLVFGVLLGWLLAWLLSKCCKKSCNTDNSGDLPLSGENFASETKTTAGLAPAGLSRAGMIKAATAAGIFFAGKKNDLEIIEGIGPKIAELLNSNGIYTFAELGAASLTTLKSILERGGDNFRLANPETWAEQASLAAEYKWQELKALQDQLDGGVKKR